MLPCLLCLFGISFIHSLILSDLTAVWCQTITYRMENYEVYWDAAQRFCECTGHLAVLDTEEKQMALLSQM